MIMHNENKETANKVSDIIDQIQKAQLDAGGCFLSHRDIRNMSIGDLLFLLVPNNVTFEIKHNEHKTKNPRSLETPNNGRTEL
jgi:hypothetical protein